MSEKHYHFTSNNVEVFLIKKWDNWEIIKNNSK